jgi:hypothetical protein
MRKYTTLTSFVSIIWGPKKGPSVIGLLGVLAWYAKELGAVGSALLFDLRAVGRQALPASAFLYGCHAANNGSSAMLALDQGVVTFLETRQPDIAHDLRLRIADFVLRELIVRRIVRLLDQLRLGNPCAEACTFDVGTRQVRFHPLRVIFGLGFVGLFYPFFKVGFGVGSAV